jgi:hypothetical protein
MTDAGRRLIAGAITLLASVMILVTLIASYVNHAFVNTTTFADHATSVLHSDGVDHLIVTRVTDQVIPNATEAASIRPDLELAVHDLVSSRPVTNEFRAAAESLQEQLVSGNAHQLTLQLPNVGTALASRVSSTSPELADDLNRIGTVTVLDVPIPSTAASIVHGTVSFSKNASLLVILTIALIVLALIVTPERRRTVIRLGLGAVLSGVLVVVFYLLGRELVASEFSGDAAQTAARAVWSGYLSGIELPALFVAGGGIVAVGAAAIL